jgi:hypothetical protein
LNARQLRASNKEALKGETTMGISKTGLATVVLVPSLLFAIGRPAHAGSTEQAAPIDAQVLPASPQGNTLLGMISGLLTDTDPTPRPKNKCGASHLYSQHDVVGDPEGCFMGRLTIGNGSVAPAAAAVP